MQVANWRMEKLEVDSKSGSDEEFYDCIGECLNEQIDLDSMNQRAAAFD